MNRSMSAQDTFGCALAELWARDGIVVDDSEALAHRVATLCASGDDGVKAASELLTRSGVRARWNETLRHDRAIALASRIRPLVAEPLLDVLAGDGSICHALSALGVSAMAATERCGDYETSLLPSHVAFRPFADDFDLSPFEASTALVSAVLHHEPDPVRLLCALAQAAIPRWIVVENCVTAAFSRPFHQLADRFFNTCLNQFGIPCADQHRTLNEWVDLLAGYGTVVVMEEDFVVPGIPFPYSLLVVDCDDRRAHQRC